MTAVVERITAAEAMLEVAEDMSDLARRVGAATAMLVEIDARLTRIEAAAGDADDPACRHSRPHRRARKPDGDAGKAAAPPAALPDHRRREPQSCSGAAA
jgi:hypothetical protein